MDYADGGVTEDPNDFGSDGFGSYLGQDIAWTNIAGYANGGTNGNNWVNSDQPSIHQVSGAQAGYMVVATANDALWFVGTPSSNHPLFYGQSVLASAGSSGDLEVTTSTGELFCFYGFESSIPSAQQGQLAYHRNAAGLITTVDNYDSSGRLTTMVRTDGTSTETYTYAYLSSGVNAGLMSSVTLSRNGTPIRKVQYTYYDGTTAFGNAGDLELEQVTDGSNNVLDTNYYRYYKPGDTGGYAGGLKYVFHADAYARLAAAVANPTVATDLAVAPYADQYFEYDSNHRVSKTIIQGTTCSCSGSSGLGTYTYTYTMSSGSSTDYNNWSTKTVETLPDGNQNIVFTNFAGEVTLSAFYDITDAGTSSNNGKVWATSYRYDSAGRVVLTAQPSAVTITSLTTLNSAATTYPDVVGWNISSGTYQYIASHTGLVEVTDYGTSTTATASAAGNVVGYAKDHAVRNGTSGTVILTDSEQYISHSDSAGDLLYPLATSTVYRFTDGTGAETTTYTYTFFSGTNAVQSTTESDPTVTLIQNGPGSADTEITVYDAYGRPTWTKDGDGFITYTAYDNATGAVVESIVDVNTSLTSEFTGLPSGWSTPSGGGLNLVTTYTVDGMGRTLCEVDPNGEKTFNVYDDVDHEVRTYAGWNSTTGTAAAPTVVSREDRPGSYSEVLTMTATPAVTGSAGSYVPTGTEAISGILSLERTLTDNSGRTIEDDQYVSMAGTSYSTTPHLGVATTNYNPTYYGYDVRGRLSRVVDAVGTITDTTYDSLGRVVAASVGTSDGYLPGSTAPVNMKLVSSDAYDNGGVGDSLLTTHVEYPDGIADAYARITQYAYDWRDREIAMKEGVQTTEDTFTHRPAYGYTLDNLGEVTQVNQYDSDGLSLANSLIPSRLRATSSYLYDEDGQLYRTLEFEVNQSTGSISDSALTTNFYYDHRGDVVADLEPGGVATKSTYDGAGRLIKEAQTDGVGPTAWSDESGVAGDHVLSETYTTYDADGNVILTTTKDRDNLDTGFGDLTDSHLGNTGNSSRNSYVAYYYDAVDRLIASVDVGTNGGVAYSAPAHGSAVPARSDTVLVTSYTYDTPSLSGSLVTGWSDTTTDPRGVVSKTSYDLLGQATQTIDAYDPTVNSGLPTASANSTTNYTYDGIGDVLTVTAVMPAGTPSQTTTYVYGVSTGTGSQIASNDLLFKIIQPDPTTGALPTNPTTLARQTESFDYDALGETIRDHQATGTVHTLGYDILGRLSVDQVTTLGPGVDNTVMMITTNFDTGGRPYLYTSFDGASNVINQVQRNYNGLGQVVTEYQQKGGSVTPSSPAVWYGYDEIVGGENDSRIWGMSYPDGRALRFVYTGLDAVISRVSAIYDFANNALTTELEGYSYLGLDTIVTYAHPQSGVDLTYIKQSSDSHANADANDVYTGLDRFGRIIDQNWVSGDTTSTWASTDRFQYAYDRDGDALYKNNLVNPAESELYHANSTTTGDNNTAYDPLGRLSSFARGTLSSSGHNGATGLDTIASASRTQSWSLDALGNQTGVTTNGSTLTRGFNANNQATSISSGTAPSFDNDGNTIAEAGQQYVYDAWNRLEAVLDGSGNVIARYRYDGLNRRNVEFYAASNVTTNLLYSLDGNVIEERANGTATANTTYQYVWGIADNLILRDVAPGGTLIPSQRLYVQTDANGNVTALLSPSGAVQERYVYDAYGIHTILDASWTPRAGNNSAFSWQYLFQSGRRDWVSGWYEFGARDFIPNDGRWAERDPLGLAADDLNIYRFVGNNPIVFVDPEGLWDWPSWTYGSAGDWLDRNIGGGQFGAPDMSGNIYGYAISGAAAFPVAGEINDAGQVLTGRDTNGNELSFQDRAVTAAAAGVPFVSGPVLRAAAKVAGPALKAAQRKISGLASRVWPPKPWGNTPLCNNPSIAPKAKNAFPSDPNDLTKQLGVPPSKVTTTPDGTTRMVWEPNSNTRIRYESHPDGLTPSDPGFNPRHHGEHYHVEMKPDGVTWGQAQRRGSITKGYPDGYTPGSGTGFLPNEPFPGN